MCEDSSPTMPCVKKCVASHKGRFKILVVRNNGLLVCILPEINFGLAQNTNLHLDVMCQVVQNTGVPKIQNTDGARATSVI
jgi:hypothetical protein